MIRVRTIGQSTIEIGERTLTPESDVLFGVCLYLLFNGGRQVPRTELLGLFWPNVDEKVRRHRLRQALYRLKQVGLTLEFAGSAVRARDPQLNVREDREIASLRSRLRNDGDAIAVEFLPNYAASFSAAFNDWIETERRNATHEVLQNLLRIIADARPRDDHEDTELAARLALSLDPFSEPATLALAESVATRGRPADAIQLLDRFIEEIGVHASPAKRAAVSLRRRLSEGVEVTRSEDAGNRSWFVGRESQLRLMLSHLSREPGSAGAAFLLHGDAGIGKTRLATEVAFRACLQGYHVLQLQAHAGDANRPLGALIDLVPPLLRLPGSLGTSPDALACLERIIHGRSDGLSSTEVLHDGDQVFGRIADSFIDLVDAVHAEARLFIRIEDGHWLDPTSLKLVRRLAAFAPERGWIIVATVRTGIPPSGNPDALLDDPSFLCLRIPPLDNVECRTLLRNVISRNRDRDHDFENWCLATSDGNPLFLLELARHFLETGARAPVPHSLADLLHRRLRALSPPALLLFQCIAVFGKRCTIQRLEGALEFPGHTLIAALDELSRAQLVVDRGDAVACRHELLSESALSLLSPLAVSHMHRRAGTILERDYATSQSFGALWGAARHWSLAGDRQRALDLACQCGTQLVDIGLADEAAGIFHDALGYTEQSRDHARVLSHLAEAQARAGHWAETVKTLETRQRLLSSALEGDGLAVDEVRILESLWRLGATGQEIGVRVVSACQSKDFSPKERAEVIVLGLKAADNHADVGVIETMVTLLSDLRDNAAVPKELVLQADVIYHASYGDLDAAACAITELLAIARLSNNPVFLSRTLRWGVDTYRRAGLLSRAWACADEAVAVSEARLSPAERMVSYLATVFLAQYTDAWDRVEPALTKAREYGATAAPHDPWVRPAIFTISARAALQRNDMSELTALAQWRFEGAVMHHQTRGKAKLLAAQCAVQEALTPGGASIDQQRELEELYTLLSTRGDQDHLVTVLVRLLSQSGAYDAAMRIMRRYVGGDRRERYTLPSELQTLRRKLGC